MSTTTNRTRPLWTIRLRLLVSFFVIFLTLAGYGLYISNATQHIHHDLVLAQQRNEQYKLLWMMKYFNRHMTGKVRGVVFTQSDEVRERLRREYDITLAQYDEVVDQLRRGAVSQAEFSLIDDLDRAGQQLRLNESTMLAAVLAGDAAAARTLARDQYVAHEAVFVDQADRLLEREGVSIATSVNLLRERSLNLDMISFVILSILLSLILFIYFLIYRHVIQPIHALAVVTGKFAAGDFAVRAPVHTHDEIGTLAATFNEMGERLDKRARELELAKQNLESEVERRTTELEAKVQELERFNKFAIGRELKMAELKKQLKRLQGPRHAA